MTSNSIALIGARVTAMGLGFLFWLLAARLFPAPEVGLAAAVISAMMLCTNIALLGLGAAVISRLPHHRAAPAALLNSVLSLVTVASAVVAALFLLVALVALSELSTVAERPLYGVLFLVTVVFGTLVLALEQTSTAMRRGDHALVRGIVQGVVTVVALVGIVVVSDATDSLLLLVPWVAATFAAMALGVRQLHRSVSGYRARWSIGRPLARELFRAGLPNHALTLAERTPALLLPVIVVEVLSPADNATWYAVWMMALIVFTVPVQVGMALFAEVADDAGRLAASVRTAIRAALFVGVPAAILLAILAHPLLSLLGSGYADQGTGPLRILVVAILPLTLVQAYFAACRGSGRLGEAIATGWTSGAVALLAAAIAVSAGGLSAMAVAWLLVQVATAVWAAVRLRSLNRSRRAAETPVAVGLSETGLPAAVPPA
jgi:O-antigen/teichoic acid export membrane protein